MAKTAIATMTIERGMLRTGSRASSDMFETVSIPVYAIIAIGIASRKLLQVGAMPKWTFVDEDVRAEDEDEAEQHEQHLRREVDRGEYDVDLRRLLDPDDVQDDEQDDDDAPTMMSHGFCRSGSQKIER